MIKSDHNTERKMRRECHPLLSGVRENSKYKHGFSVAEMESLTSICEVVLPSLPMDDALRKDDESSKDVQSFFNISASMYPIPDEVYICLYMCVYLLLSFCVFFPLSFDPKEIPECKKTDPCASGWDSHLGSIWLRCACSCVSGEVGLT